MARKPLNVTPREARTILDRCGIIYDVDYDTLRSSVVNDLLEWADKIGYRKPKNANGSRGRYFHAYLTRIIARELV